MNQARMGIMGALLVGLLLACDSSSIAAREIQFEVRVDERMSRFCKRLENQQIYSCAEFREAAGKEEFKQFAFLPAPVDALHRFEGMFRPGQYRVDAKQSLVRTIEQMLEKTRRELLDLDTAADSRPVIRISDIILASIVEKEAASNKDYNRIAAVFLNRLQKKQQLGSCPTVEYALGYHRPFLLFKDLELQSPYNVYKRKGLPPTPIAFFSKEAYAAVLRPARTADFFFVFDWTDGNLYFAEEYSQHKRNASRARENFIQKYGREHMYRAFPELFYESIDPVLAAENAD